MNHFKVKCVRARSGVRSLAAEHDQSESEQVRYSDRQVQIYAIRQVAQINLSDEQTITLKVRDHHYIRFQVVGQIVTCCHCMCIRRPLVMDH